MLHRVPNDPRPLTLRGSEGGMSMLTDSTVFFLEGFVTKRLAIALPQFICLQTNFQSGLIHYLPNKPTFKGFTNF